MACVVCHYLEMVGIQVKGQRRQPDQPEHCDGELAYPIREGPRQRGSGCAEQRQSAQVIGHRGHIFAQQLVMTSCSDAGGLVRRRRLKRLML